MQDWLLKRVSSKVPSPGGDRGIVVPAGGVDQLANAFVNIYVLRHHLGTTLPITIAYWGTLQREAIDPETVKFFQSHLSDINFLDLSRVEYPGHQRWLFPPIPDTSYVGFKVKVFALYAAPYKEVLVIDSDSMPLIDPTTLFDTPEYKKYGNLFWPDRWCTAVKLFGRLGMDDGGGHRLQADSGQFLFDRNRHWQVMEWLLFLNTHNEFTYRYAHGDKDTYRVAFELAGRGGDYLQVPQPLSVALQPNRLIGALARGFVQHHPNGSVGFVHRTSEAKYKAHSTKGRAFSRLLLQPSCQWNQRYWHFFSPAWRATRSKVWRQKKCGFSLYAPDLARKHCAYGSSSSDSDVASTRRQNSATEFSNRKMNEHEAGIAVQQQQQDSLQQPPLLEVSHTSYVWKAQEAADAALLIVHAHVQSRPDLYPRHGGGGFSIIRCMLLFGCVGAVVWGGVRVIRRRKGTTTLVAGV